MPPTDPAIPTADEVRSRSATSYIRYILLLIVIVPALAVSASFGYYSVQVQPPVDFPVDSTFTISEGSSVSTIATQLKTENIVRSANLLYFIFLTKYDATALKAGVYNLTEPLDAHAVAALIVAGDNTANLLRITHLEGDSVDKLAPRIADVVTDFDSEQFISAATPLEGTLFPDTYLVPPTITVNGMIELMQRRYQEATATITDAIAAHPLSEDEIINLASIIEREANSPDSMRMVSGILQNRLNIGMALQVDASMEYALDKPLSELVPQDLQQDSPYNTYLYQGLPPTPIGNPGIESILAVLQPTPSNYFYYITGNDGQFYYAETFDEHRRNIARYLR